MSSSLSCTGVIHDSTFLESELRRYGFTADRLGSLMKTYGFVMGGGFATNVLLRHVGHSVAPLPKGADIDFYVFGCIRPVPPNLGEWPTDSSTKSYFESPSAARYSAEARAADILKNLTLTGFIQHIQPLGYTQCCPTHEETESYEPEASTDGDRIFTTGSKIFYQVLFFQRTDPMGHIQKLNLVFVDTDLHTVMNKVDIALTAGFITGNPSGIWIYHHAAPADLKNLWVRWMQPSSTHTPRQLARLEKYCLRYDVDPAYVMTVPEFLAAYDTLPDKCHIELKCTRAEITKPVLRRVRGLAEASVVFDTGDA